ncbi:septum site-determining protein MinC [Paenibacillus flagellatus]|uniref:Probable septum site-determining protein MinC n=1 Tax=Paenibacillus flagellatus TaxID=2211139 RepID=A0A2V5KE44_9BACL|nr:septum site-determining protein MinC [Paenibacillus flagellatus]PYI52250.1 septum site-determining protein MinC [Paenibacillus flagellatus]
MSAPETKHRVTIKGVKEGLVFVIDDSCPFEEAIQELTHKLDKTHSTILTGPAVHVQVRLGKRTATESEKETIKDIIGRKSNLLVQSIESDEPGSDKREQQLNRISVLKGIVRSGQTIRHEGHLLYLGDINPGGTLLCTGDIFVLGALRGMAHAGIDGNDRAVIAASYMRPTQLRIADVISRPPDEWGIEDATMEFAYIHEGKMEIDKINQLHRLRPDHPFGGT